MSKSMGGALGTTSTFNWKFSAIQQVSLVLSKRYNSCEDSYKQAAGNKNRLNMGEFRAFVEKEQALNGFNLTEALYQQLFSELDAHKKGYLDLNDWTQIFGTFKWSDQLLVELKNILQCSFGDCESAFNFFLTFTKSKGKKLISEDTFLQAVKSITSNRFKPKEIKQLYTMLAPSAVEGITMHEFRRQFEGLAYTGKSRIKTVGSLTQGRITSSNAALHNTSSSKGSRTTIQTTSTQISKWETDIIEKLRYIVKSSALSLR